MSLKDALLKAGLRPTKAENSREYKPVKEKKKSEIHQEQRNYCEVCNTTQPDVERFKHRQPLIDAEWICVNCADKAEILDDFRISNQSDFAKRRIYRRYYGPTKDFSKVDASRPSRPNQHSSNQNNQGQKKRYPNRDDDFNR